MYKTKATSQVDEKTIERLLPYIINRAGAGLLDVVLVMIVAFVFFMFSLSGILNNQQYIDGVEQSKRIIADSHLYDSEGNTFEYDAKKYDEIITYFYSHNNKVLLEQYNDRKQKSGLFDYDGNKYVLKEEANSDEVDKFYTVEYQQARLVLTNSTELREMSLYAINLFVTSLVICLSVSLIVFYLVIPLISKNKSTLAQSLNKIRPVDFKSFTIISNKQVFLRFLVYSFLYFYLPIYAIQMIGGHVIIIDTLLVVFNITNKYNRGLQDLLSFSIMVDSRKYEEGVFNNGE